MWATHRYGGVGLRSRHSAVSLGSHARRVGQSVRLGRGPRGSEEGLVLNERYVRTPHINITELSTEFGHSNSVN